LRRFLIGCCILESELGSDFFLRVVEAVFRGGFGEKRLKMVVFSW